VAIHYVISAGGVTTRAARDSIERVCICLIARQKGGYICSPLLPVLMNFYGVRLTAAPPYRATPARHYYQRRLWKREQICKPLTINVNYRKLT